MSKELKNEEAEALFVEKYSEIKRYLLKRVFNEDDARELAQEAFERILRVDNKTFIRDPAPYLMQIAKNLAYKHWEKSKKMESSDIVELQTSDHPSTSELEDEVNAHQRLVQLNQAMQHLSPNVRQALIMHKRDGYTQEEIAQELNVSKSMVKKYLRTGIFKIRERMLEETADD